MGGRGSAADQVARYKGFDVVKDTVEIDELLGDDNSISIEACKGFVLVEIPQATFGGLTTGDIFERAQELADKSKPYGIDTLTWKHAYEANDCFIRFTVDEWEQISQAERDEDNKDIQAEDRFEAAREARLG